MFWTESGIRRVAGEEISGPKGAASTRKHVMDLLGEQTAGEVGAELQKAAEQLAENAKAALHRKLNTIYAAQCARLEQRLAAFKSQLEKIAPEQERRLDALKGRLDDVEEACEGWLERPRAQLERLVEDRQKAFSDDLSRPSRDSAHRTKTMLSKTEKKLADVIDERLHDLVIEAVREHITSTRFEDTNLSNRQIAKLKGISLRAVKRQRNTGMV